MLQVMGLILSQLVPSAQQRTVVLPARGMQSVPEGQQRPEGRSGQADWEEGQVSEEDWRLKREVVGMASVVKGCRRSRRLIGISRRVIVDVEVAGVCVLYMVDEMLFRVCLDALRVSEVVCRRRWSKILDTGEKTESKESREKDAEGQVLITRSSPSVFEN
jgi:hypothetical protein